MPEPLSLAESEPLDFALELHPVRTNASPADSKPILPNVFFIRFSSLPIESLRHLSPPQIFVSGLRWTIFFLNSSTGRRFVFVPSQVASTPAWPTKSIVNCWHGTRLCIPEWAAVVEITV